VQYIWADPSQPQQQVALSSIVQAMLIEDKEVMAIARWVTKDGMDPKMGVLLPVMFDNIDCLLWVQVRDLFITLNRGNLVDVRLRIDAIRG
jgi:ATP-dependent DNA helicase 2 subunit 2